MQLRERGFEQNIQVESLQFVYGQRSMMMHTSPHCSGSTMIARIVGIEIVGEQHGFDLFFLVYSNYTYFWYLQHILWHFNIFAVIKPCYWCIYQHDIFAMNIKHLFNYFEIPRYSVFHTRKVESLSPSITHTKISPKTKTHKRRKLLMNIQLIVVIIFMPCTIENINIVFYIWIEMSIYFCIYFHLKCNIIIFLLKNLQVLFLLI